jgi:hypothetical protein
MAPLRSACLIWWNRPASPRMIYHPIQQADRSGGNSSHRDSGPLLDFEALTCTVSELQVSVFRFCA